MKTCSGNKPFFTESCHCQTYQNYEQSRQKLGTFLENEVIKKSKFSKTFLSKVYVGCFVMQSGPWTLDIKQHLFRLHKLLGLAAKLFCCQWPQFCLLRANLGVIYYQHTSICWLTIFVLTWNYVLGSQGRTLRNTSSVILRQ